MKILIAEPYNFSREAISILGELGDVCEKEVKQEDLLDVVYNVNILFIRLGLKITREVIDNALKLQIIACPATGLDHIDVDHALSRGIKIVSLKGEIDFLRGVPSTAELTWGLLLSLVRKIPFASQQTLGGKWDRDFFRGNNLKGKRLGILGYGRVGEQVAEYARAFQMEVGAYDVESKKIKSLPVVAFGDPESLMKWCDILTVHIPLNEQNRNFINRDLLSEMRAGSWLINTSRGGIWDEMAIVDLLESGNIAGVATDVLSVESSPMEIMNNPLLKYARAHHNVIITPHLGGATYESMEMTEIFIAKKVVHLTK